MKHLLMVRFRPTRQGRKQVERDGAKVQFVDLPPLTGRDISDQLVVRQSDFLAGIEVKVARTSLDPRADSPRSLFNGRVGCDQVRINGVAQVRQVQAAERAVPVTAVALAPVKFLPSNR